MTFALLLSILTSTLMCVAFCDTTDGSNQEFDADSFEKTPFSDQKQDGTVFGDSESFGSNDKGNFFMYQHVPKKDHYDFSYRRGNDHHVKEHHEKAAPHEGHFKIHARWGDKHGGYGEQYWDYNHGGGAHEEGGGNEEINGEYSGEVRSPSVIPTTTLTGAETSDGYAVDNGEYRPKKKLKKPTKIPKYEEIRTRKHKHGSTAARMPIGSTESNYFTIPKKYSDSTSIYPLDQRETSKYNTDYPYNADTYDQLRDLPSTYEQYNDGFPKPPNPKDNPDMFPSVVQPRHNT